MPAHPPDTSPPRPAPPAAGTFPASILTGDVPSSTPPMTMAFCAVEGAKALAARSRRDAKAVHDVCLGCVRNTLRYVRGGYLCRAQPGELKYLVAFADAEVAVHWALMLQVSDVVTRTGRLRSNGHGDWWCIYMRRWRVISFPPLSEWAQQVFVAGLTAGSL